jgi:hypothetical protein
MRLTGSTSGTPKPSALALAKSLASRLATAARFRPKAAVQDAGGVDSPHSTAQAGFMTDHVSPLVIGTCYESYVDMYEMLAVFAEQRGDDPEDALGPAPESKRLRAS